MKCLECLIGCLKLICSNQLLSQSSPSRLMTTPSFHLLRPKTIRIIIDSSISHRHNSVHQKTLSTLPSKYGSQSTFLPPPWLELPSSRERMIAGAARLAPLLPSWLLCSLFPAQHSEWHCRNPCPTVSPLYCKLPMARIVKAPTCLH